MSEAAAPIVIIGGTSGIGLATAKLFAARGDAVVIVGRDRDKLTSALDGLSASARGETADASDRGALNALFARLKRIGHLVIAASGGSGAGPFRSVAGEALRRGFEAKFWVHWNTAQAALAHLEPDGSITFVTAASRVLPTRARPGSPRSTARSTGWSRHSPASSRRCGSMRCRPA